MNEAVASIHLAFARLPEPPLAEPQGLLPALSADDLDRLAGFRQPADRWRLALGRALLRHVLGFDHGIQGPAIAISERGRPYLAVDNPLGLDINISHAGSWVVCGVVARARIGVDVIDIDDLADWPELAGHFLDASETAFIMGLPAETRARAASSFWTLKEAVLKAAGYGLEIDPRLLRMALQPHPRLLACPPEVTSHPGSVWMASLEHAPGSLLAVAILGSERRCADPLALKREIVPIEKLFVGHGQATPSLP